MDFILFEIFHIASITELVETMNETTKSTE